jgi:hypothetical protein
LKEYHQHIHLEHSDKSATGSTVSTSSSASSYATTPSSPPNMDKWISSSGRQLRLSCIPTIWTGRMATVLASHGNLFFAPWKIIGSLHHITEDLGSPWVHTGSGTHQPPPWCPSFLPLLLLPHPPPHACDSLAWPLSLARLFPAQHTLTLLPCLFPRPAKPPLFRAIKTPVLFSVDLWLCESPAVSFYLMASQWELRSTLPLSSCFLYDPKFLTVNYSACHLLSHSYLVRLIQPWRCRRYVPPKCWLTFSGLHGIISQKIVLFIITAVRTSNPIYNVMVQCLGTVISDNHMAYPSTIICWCLSLVTLSRPAQSAEENIWAKNNWNNMTLKKLHNEELHILYSRANILR